MTICMRINRGLPVYGAEFYGSTPADKTWITIEIALGDMVLEIYGLGLAQLRSVADDLGKIADEADKIFGCPIME